MQYLISYILVFMIIFIILYIFEFILKDKKNNLGTTKSFNFIVKKYNLNMDRQRVRILSKLIILSNAFIISIPVMLIMMIKIEYYLILIISFVIFIILILIFYNLLGFILVKKGWKK